MPLARRRVYANDPSRALKWCTRCRVLFLSSTEQIWVIGLIADSGWIITVYYIWD
jgi:hypothetical protein